MVSEGGGGCCGGAGRGRVWRSVGEELAGLIRCAVRARRDSCGIGNRRDGAEGLVGLGVGLDDAIRIRVDTREVLVIAKATQIGVVNIGGGGVVLAANAIVDMLAVVSGVGSRRIASLEAKGSTTHEVVPFDGLDEVTGEGCGEEQSAERVTTLVGTMGVELSSIIIGGDVDEPLVDVAGDLNVVGGLHELHTGDGTLGDDTSAVARLCAPRDTFTFCVADGGVRVRWTPETEV